MEFFARFAVFPSEALAKESFAPFAVKKKSCRITQILVLAVLLTIPLSSYPQHEKTSEQLVSIAEELAADETDEETQSLYAEQLNELAENPVKINSADEPEISRLFFLNDFQVRALADHVKNTGRIVSEYEIAAIPGFDRHTTEMIISFIDLSAKSESTFKSVKFHNSLLSHFIIKPGESDTSDLVSSYKFLSKYRFTAGRFAGGFTTEKDAGEKFFDFISGNFSFSGKGFIKKIIIGDFAARFGQGLNINTGIRTGLSLTAPGYMASRNEISPYTSTDENNFFRGIAAQFAFKNAGIVLFLSHNSIDATISVSSDSSSYFLERFYRTGLHNSESLMSKKDAVAETSYGINLTYTFRHLKTGLCYSENRFSLPVLPDISDPVDLYDFRGNRCRLFSGHYSCLVNRLLLFGEISMSDIQSYALVQGATLRPSDRLSINMLLMNYSPGYTSFHGNGPGSNASNNNEQSILGNFTFEAAKHFFISAGCNITHFPWMKYICSFPSFSRRTEIKLNYMPLEDLAFDLTYNIRYSQSDNDQHTGIPGIAELGSRWLKGQVKYGFSDRISLMTRFDYKIAEPSGSKGMLFLQDVMLSFRKVPVTLWFRYCIFNTDDWDSRLYAYENDLLHSFSIPSLSGKGTRSYLMAKWEIGKMAELRVRYSITAMDSNNNIDEKDELKFQIRLWF
jgi:hypothetical protein